VINSDGSPPQWECLSANSQRYKSLVFGYCPGG
jgi:hypothetical protein